MTREGEKIILPKPDRSGCFGCGTDNPLGLKLSFYCVDRTVRSDVTLNQHHMGWANLAHGGIISTVLDEIMGWTVLAFKRVFFVTRKIEIRYLRPVRLDRPLTAVGEIESDAPPKGCCVAGRLVDAGGTLLAEGKAQMTYLSEKRLPLLPEHYKVEMERLFDEMRELLG